MVAKLYIPFWALLLFVMPVNNKGLLLQEKFISISHEVVVNHPGEKSPSTVVLIEVRDSNGLPLEYYMDVESVICLEAVCKVIPVRIYWNNIGVYQRYELDNNGTLEKYKADLFEPEDYKKLDSILANPASPFKEVYINDILTVVNELSEGVDAISGATALELDEKDTVPGAALTCFTLWHWANGEIVSIIKNLTGEAVTNQQLMAFLQNMDDTYYYLVLEQFAKRGIYADEYFDHVLERAKDNAVLIRPTIGYIESAPEEVYFMAIKRLLGIGNHSQKIAALKSIQNIEHVPSIDYLNSLATNISKLDSFQEIAAFLELMEIRGNNSEMLINNILPLLDKDILLARRSYWFLSSVPLNAEQKKKVDNFFAQNKDRL